MAVHPQESEYKALPTSEPGAEESLPEIGDDEVVDIFREWVGQVFVKGDCFQSFVAVIILANAIVIGLETDLASMESLWDVFETAFLIIFVAELLLRLFYLRLDFFFGQNAAGNIFDLALVGAGLVDFTVHTIFHGNLGQFGVFMKACRLLRILRLFRLFKMVKQLYMLASGFAESAMAVFWVSVLCSLLLYICSIFLTRMLGHSSSHARTEKMQEFYTSHFGTIGNSMFTLFKLMSNPDLGEMEDIMMSNPCMMIFFVVFIVYGSFAMLSILTGVISEGMIEKGNSHKDEMRFAEERKKKEFMLRLRRHFEESDVDHDGTMTREEFEGKLPEMINMFQEQGFFYSEGDLQTVFDLVDFDRGGTVEVEEFLQGMTSFTANVSDLPLQFLRLQSNLFLHVNKLEGTIATRFDKIDRVLQNLDAKLNSSLLQPAGAGSPQKRHVIC